MVHPDVCEVRETLCEAWDRAIRELHGVRSRITDRLHRGELDRVKCSVGALYVLGHLGQGRLQHLRREGVVGTELGQVQVVPCHLIGELIWNHVPEHSIDTLISILIFC